LIFPVRKATFELPVYSYWKLSITRDYPKCRTSGS
jgi:hypothetical protein